MGAGESGKVDPGNRSRYLDQIWHGGSPHLQESYRLCGGRGRWAWVGVAILIQATAGRYWTIFGMDTCTFSSILIVTRAKPGIPASERIKTKTRWYIIIGDGEARLKKGRGKGMSGSDRDLKVVLECHGGENVQRQETRVKQENRRSY